MAEFDFDELDKAVSDLMSNVSTDKRNTALDDPEDKVVTIEDTPAITAVPAATAVAPAAAPSQSAATTPSLATKRRGQFMDIMHPSQSKSTKPALASRQGVTIQPATQSMPEPVPGVAPTVDTPAPVSIPDPIDAMATVPAETTPDTTDEPAPLMTPFLADAKVEKRPLGANGSVVITDSAEEADAEAQIAPAPSTTVPVVLPEELTGDVLAVESNDLSAAVSTSELMGPKVEEATEAVVPEPQEEIAQPPKDLVVPVEEVAEPTGPASIPQQYTEQPSSGDQSNGSIYDTATYHQAIEGETSSKKHTTLKWTLIIVGLLVLGAAAGAAVFYYTR